MHRWRLRSQVFEVSVPRHASGNVKEVTTMADFFSTSEIEKRRHPPSLRSVQRFSCRWKASRRNMDTKKSPQALDLGDQLCR